MTTGNNPASVTLIKIEVSPPHLLLDGTLLDGTLIQKTL